MSQFEERNNEDKEEAAVYGITEAEKIRMLGSRLGPKEDMKNRKKSGNTLGKK